MAEPRADQTPDDETLVTPRFDEEETVLAQPVVPLEAAAELPPAEPHVAAARPYAPRSPRGPWPLALILVSALVGSVIGGTGLYFFQKHRRAASAPAQPAAVPVETTQPAPAPTVEQAAQQSAPPEVSQPAPEPSVEEPAAPEPAPERAADDDDEERTAEPAPARDLPVREEAPRRGKKGDRDAELQRRERDSSDDDAPAARNAPRRVDSIVYPTRREERRAQRQAERRARRAERQAERLRAIFEGEPE